MSIKRLQAKTHATSALTVVGIIGGLVIIAVVVLGVLGFLQPKPLGWIVGSGRFGAHGNYFTDPRPCVGVEIKEGFQVRITKSSTYNATIIADTNVFEYLDVYQTVDTLVLGLKVGYNYKDLTLRAEITMPNIEYMELSGESNCVATGFDSDSYFTLRVSGASNVTLEGSASQIVIVASEKSRVDLRNFRVKNADVYIMSGSGAILNAEDTIVGTVIGDSHIRYIGTPTIIVTDYDDSTVEQFSPIN